MAKIILSRKGFDSSYGGRPSPILPDGTMISFPIPAEDYETVSAPYGELKCGNLTYIDLMKQLKVKKIEDSTKVHLDPDINYSVVERKSKDWKAILGQCKGSATHLANQGVGKGDIFLFFGWFKKVILTEQGYKYDPADGNGRHVIWAYMEIDDVINIEEGAKYPECYLAHPHFQYRNWKNNIAYVASEKLSFSPKMSGAGVFKFDERLILSYDSERRSFWKLPKFFHPDNGVSITHNVNPEKWAIKDDCCILKSADIGQEFVISEHSDVENWAKGIILNNINEKFQHV